MSMGPGWKRRVRSEAELSRKPGKRQPRRLLLVVCEDAKAAPAYFNALRDHLRLETSRVEVCGRECGSAPISVVDFAIQRRRAHQKAGRIVDTTFCVIDADDHESIFKALDKANANGLTVAVSSPCFEIWYLLHFAHGGRAYPKRDVLYRDLRKHLPDYDKGSFKGFDVLWDKMTAAIERAKLLVGLREDDRLRNPSTEVHVVVEAFIAETRRLVDGC